MAKIDRMMSKFTRKKRTSRKAWLSALAIGIGATTAAVGVSRGRGNRWIRKMQNSKLMNFHKSP